MGSLYGSYLTQCKCAMCEWEKERARREASVWKEIDGMGFFWDEATRETNRLYTQDITKQLANWENEGGK